MKRRLLTCALYALCAASLAACERAAANRAAPGAPDARPAPNVQPARAAEEPEEYPKDITEEFAREDSLTLNGYEVSKRARASGTTYAVLRRKGRVVAKFDDGDSDFDFAAGFGAFPFLGGGARQLAVSLTLPRYGRHWVVDLSSASPRVLFDSGDYGVGREDFRVIDLDGDGTYEIVLPVTTFYMFENMSMAETPLPEIVFRYDAKARRYLPANRLFPGYALRRVERDIESLRPDNPAYMSDRLDVLLRYVYAGREREGWDFFDRAYERADRDALKKKIAAELSTERVYRFLHRASAKRRS